MSELKRIWISDRIADQGKKKKDLSEALGLPHTRISDIINSKRSLKITEIKPFADFMNMSYSEVLSRFSLKQEDFNAAYDALVYDEKQIIESYRGLSESGKQKFQEFLVEEKNTEDK
ncbi:MAG: helix-turn-helix transcriptional regulator [Emcibacteraceae bacterium]|nr:helix-turn-helix transcriptional regulator [Emcibacteraceae bacterium]